MAQRSKRGEKQKGAGGNALLGRQVLRRMQPLVSGWSREWLAGDARSMQPRHFRMLALSPALSLPRFAADSDADLGELLTPRETPMALNARFAAAGLGEAAGTDSSARFAGEVYAAPAQAFDDSPVGWQDEPLQELVTDEATAALEIPYELLAQYQEGWDAVAEDAAPGLTGDLVSSEGASGTGAQRRAAQANPAGRPASNQPAAPMRAQQSPSTPPNQATPARVRTAARPSQSPSQPLRSAQPVTVQPASMPLAYSPSEQYSRLLAERIRRAQGQTAAQSPLSQQGGQPAGAQIGAPQSAPQASSQQQASAPMPQAQPQQRPGTQAQSQNISAQTAPVQPAAAQPIQPQAQRPAQPAPQQPAQWDARQSKASAIAQRIEKAALSRERGEAPQVYNANAAASAASIMDQRLAEGLRRQLAEREGTDPNAPVDAASVARKPGADEAAKRAERWRAFSRVEVLSTATPAPAEEGTLPKATAPRPEDRAATQGVSSRPAMSVADADERAEIDLGAVEVIEESAAESPAAQEARIVEAAGEFDADGDLVDAEYELRGATEYALPTYVAEPVAEPVAGQDSTQVVLGESEFEDFEALLAAMESDEAHEPDEVSAPAPQELTAIAEQLTVDAARSEERAEGSAESPAITRVESVAPSSQAAPAVEPRSPGDSAVAAVESTSEQPATLPTTRAETPTEPQAPAQADAKPNAGKGRGKGAKANRRAATSAETASEAHLTTPVAAEGPTASTVPQAVSESADGPHVGSVAAAESSAKADLVANQSVDSEYATPRTNEANASTRQATSTIDSETGLPAESVSSNEAVQLIEAEMPTNLPPVTVAEYATEPRGETAPESLHHEMPLDAGTEAVRAANVLHADASIPQEQNEAPEQKIGDPGHEAASLANVTQVEALSTPAKVESPAPTALAAAPQEATSSVVTPDDGVLQGVSGEGGSGAGSTVNSNSSVSAPTAQVQRSPASDEAPLDEISGATSGDLPSDLSTLPSDYLDARQTPVASNTPEVSGSAAETEQSIRHQGVATQPQPPAGYETITQPVRPVRVKPVQRAQAAVTSPSAQVAAAASGVQAQGAHAELDEQYVAPSSVDGALDVAPSQPEAQPTQPEESVPATENEIATPAPAGTTDEFSLPQSSDSSRASSPQMARTARPPTAPRESTIQQTMPREPALNGDPAASPVQRQASERASLQDDLPLVRAGLSSVDALYAEPAAPAGLGAEMGSQGSDVFEPSVLSGEHTSDSLAEAPAEPFAPETELEAWVRRSLEALFAEGGTVGPPNDETGKQALAYIEAMRTEARAVRALSEQQLNRERSQQGQPLPSSAFDGGQLPQMGEQSGTRANSAPDAPNNGGSKAPATSVANDAPTQFASPASVSNAMETAGSAMSAPPVQGSPAPVTAPAMRATPIPSAAASAPAGVIQRTPLDDYAEDWQADISAETAPQIGRAKSSTPPNGTAHAVDGVASHQANGLQDAPRIARVPSLPNLDLNAPAAFANPPESATIDEMPLVQHRRNRLPKVTPPGILESRSTERVFNTEDGGAAEPASTSNRSRQSAPQPAPPSPTQPSPQVVHHKMPDSVVRQAYGIAPPTPAVAPPVATPPSISRVASNVVQATSVEVVQREGETGANGGTSGSQGRPNLEEIARMVYPLLKDMLRVERDRFGR